MRAETGFRSIFKQELPFFWATPAFVWQVLFLYIPLFLVLIYSILGNAGLSEYLTLEHYTALLDPMYAAILLRSFMLANVNALLCTLLAFPVAYYLAFFVTRFKNHLIFFLILPFWISFMVQIYAWFFVLEKHGLINSLLLNLGIISQPIHLLNTPFAIYLVMIYCYVPFAVMPIYSTLEKFDKRLLEASADLGATPWQTFLRVTLPLSALGIRTGFFLVLVPSFGEFVIPTLLGGGKQLYVGSLISHYFLLARNFNLGASFTCVSGIVLIISGISWYLLFRWAFNLSRRAQ
ncbi:MAG TPA: ABC transporter permease [Candidatus Babeliales bacterium]|nr:ABC transporter permease [Candidatus Babeliales bacterium]